MALACVSRYPLSCLKLSPAGSAKAPLRMSAAMTSQWADGLGPWLPEIPAFHWSPGQTRPCKNSIVHSTALANNLEIWNEPLEQPSARLLTCSTGFQVVQLASLFDGDHHHLFCDSAGIHR